MESLHETPGDVKPDWASLLPPVVFGAVILVLRAALPPPAVDAPGDWMGRDQVAMAAVASLAPATAAEGRLAAQFVAADAYGMDCLRLAQLFGSEPDVARRCAAQAMAMMRQSQSAMRMLLRLQAARRAVAADPAAVRQADRVEHAAVALMAEALAASPVVAGRVMEGVEITASDVRELERASDDEISSLITRAETAVGFRGVVLPAGERGVSGGPSPRPPPTRGGGEGTYFMDAVPFADCRIASWTAAAALS